MSDSSSVKTVPAAMGATVHEAIPRKSPSIRRTSHIDMHLDGHELSLEGVARDMITSHDTTSVVGQARLSATVNAMGALTGLSVDPNDGDPDRLLGLTVSRGFRDAVATAFPDDVAAGSAAALLLDDLPVATLISGYARLYTGTIPPDAARTGMKADICSGWRGDGTMMTSVQAGNGVPVTLGPIAPTLEADSEHDPLGWHDIGVLDEGSMRRRRLVDIRIEDNLWSINAMFRDTHVQLGGGETVLHEYVLRSTVDAESQTFLSCSAIPRVLPWAECPVAAASADRLIGRTVESSRDFVRRDLRGISTCTHLNDLLRSLGDVASLAETLSNSK